MSVDYSKTIYRLDFSGKSRFITYEAINGELHQSSGVVGSEDIVRNVRICKPKNVGKSNETTAEEQAVLEAKSKIKDKLAKEYFESLDASKEESSNLILPMLAKPFDEKYIEEENIYYIQPKLDGYRCVAHVKNGKVKLMSRSNKDIMLTKNNSMQHIVDQMSKFPDGVYDGELYNLNLGGFQSQTKAINKYEKGLSEKINYNIYDIVDVNLSFGERFSKFSRDYALSVVSSLVPNIKKVKTKIYNLTPLTKELLMDIHNLYVLEGYEGVIVRIGSCDYQMNKRSSQLLKVKDFFDIDVTILAVIPQNSDPTKGQPICTSLEAIHGIKLGIKFKAGMSVSHEEQINMLNNPQDYIGKTATVRFFESTDDGLPRNPVYHGLKD